MKKADKTNPPRRRIAAFTLVEMMVVIVVIAILMAGVFRLMKTVDTKTKEAQTKARLQKLQNAISAFYSEYGTYPPVPYYGSPDPYTKQDDPYNGEGTVEGGQPLSEGNARSAARCQPTEYLYPTPRKWDKAINKIYQDQRIINVNEALKDVDTRPGFEWDTEIRAFRFGLLSFLMPRFTVMGGTANGDLSGDDSPDPKFLLSRQWKAHNPGDTKEIYEREHMVIARWLPNFENFPLLGFGTIMGVNTGGGVMHFETITDPQNKQRYILLRGCIYDAWDRDLYYHSAPPYQSYRVWSAGADGRTFPPWATPESADRKMVESWTRDDIVLFDR